MLHLNDLIISDAASCNQGRGTQRGIHREVLYAWMEKQSKEALISFVLSPSVAKQKKERGKCEPQTRLRMTMKE